MAITAPDEQTIDPEHNEKLLNSPELPPRIDTLPRPRAPSLQERNVFATLLKNYKQVTSLTAGLIVLMGGGVHIVWAFWEMYSNSSGHELGLVVQVSSWYLGCIFGGIIAASVISRLNKRTIYLLSAVILFLSSLLFIIRWDLRFRSTTYILWGRLIAGVSYGMAYLTVITQAAENAVNQIRGIILRMVGYTLAFSLFLGGLTTGTIEVDHRSECIMGVVNLVYSIIAMCLAYAVTIESAPFILQKRSNGQTVADRERLVLSTMMKLRNETTETPKIRNDLDEMKRHIYEDQSDNSNIFTASNRRPLLIVTAVRLLSVCAKNVPFTVIIMTFIHGYINHQTFDMWLLFIMLSSRFIFGIITMFLVDRFECKKYLYIFAIICGVLVFIKSTYLYLKKIKNLPHLDLTSPIMVLFFIFASMGIDCIGHVQTSEAFSYAKKSWSIVFTTSTEHIVHIVLMTVFKFGDGNQVCLIVASGLIIMGLCALLTVPAKTKGLSLRQTRDIYKRVKLNLPTVG